MSVFERIRNELAKQLEIDPGIIGPDTKLMQDLGIDSIDVVEFIMTLEEKYNIIITNDEAGDLSTIGQIAAFVEKQLGKQRP